MPVDEAVREGFGETDKVFEEINQEQQDENEEIYRMV